MTSDAPLLEGRDLGRRRPGGGWLLEGISLELAAGERVAVVGPSGAGKTLLLRSLALLDPLDRGEVRFRGEAIAGDDVPAYRRRAVYLHQRPAAFEGTVEAALRRPFAWRAHHGRGFDRSRALELLGRVGRGEGFLEQPMRQLSGGEAQIVALVRALQLDPEVLFLDEPTAALDVEAARSVEALLEGWLEEHPEAAVVWVGHDLEQVGRISHRRLELRAGRLAGERSG